MSLNVNVRRLETGVPGLDNLLGGGVPEYSVNLLAGTPGSGKTTLAHQIMFSSSNPDHRALFFTVVGEPALKMLRYQQQFEYFDFEKVSNSIRFVNLTADMLDGDLDRVLTRITEEVKNYSPTMVFIDSFRSIMKSGDSLGQWSSAQQKFVQGLSTLSTSWLTTTFLIGEYELSEANASPIFANVDGIVWLSQNLQRNSVVRKMQVVKMRGQAQATGVHTFRINQSGIQVFPRAVVKQGLVLGAGQKSGGKMERVLLGVPELDEMLGGGLPVGYSLLVVGPSGSGKTILATEFLAEGARRGEPGVIAAFEKSPSQIMGNVKLTSMIQSGQVGVIDTRSLDLSIDETLHDLIEMINRMQAKRVVIDSLSGFELALAPEFSEDFRGSLYRIVAELTRIGVTILMTSEMEDRYNDLSFSPFGSALLVDAIVMYRYIEMESELRRTVSVVKVRASAHSKEIRAFEITDEGLVLGKKVALFTGILTGSPMPVRHDVNSITVNHNE